MLTATHQTTKKRLTRALMCCVAGIVVSGCVSQNTALDFSQSQTAQPVASGVSIATNQNASFQPAVTSGQSNIPVRAPRPSTALSTQAPQQATAVAAAPAAQPNSTAQVAANATTSAVVPAINASNKLAVVETGSGQTPAGNVINQATPAPATPTTVATAPVPSPTVAQGSSPSGDNNAVKVASLSPTLEAAPTVENVPEKEVQKQGFFQKLFSPQTKKPRPSRAVNNEDGASPTRSNARINTANNVSERPSRGLKPKTVKRPKTVVASVRNSNASERSALPGVKSNSEIFGIKEDNKPASNTAKTTQVAALGSLGLLSPNGLRVQHSKVQVACLKPGVLRLLKMVERRYGKKPIITSGYRSPKGNRRAGGARNSQHIFCKAVDIQVEGVSKWNLAKYLRTLPGRGGVGTYCRTKSVHIDIGSVRDWHHPCRKSSKRKRKKA